jgi:hypothetical protein
MLASGCGASCSVVRCTSWCFATAEVSSRARVRMMHAGSDSVTPRPRTSSQFARFRRIYTRFPSRLRTFATKWTGNAEFGLFSHRVCLPDVRVPPILRDSAAGAQASPYVPRRSRAETAIFKPFPDPPWSK